MAADAPLGPIATDRVFQELPEPGEDEGRGTLRAAANALGAWSIDLAGQRLDATRLRILAATPPDEPLVRAIREDLARAVDLQDLFFFLDDVAVAGASDRHGEPFHIPAGRARAAGILVHPDDLWRTKRTRVYGAKGKPLAVDEPLPQESWPPAADGDLPGPGWTMRYRNPTEEPDMLVALHKRRPTATLTSRAAALMAQLRHQGAEVYLTSTVRYPERGYLMWGAFALSRTDSEDALDATLAEVEAANRDWKLQVPITWPHPDGWRATREAARQMADAYDVVYATPSGARYSHHYDGVAIDFVALGLPRSLTLYAPDGTVGQFDLSDAEHTRDLSLEPELIAWVEEHFQLKKLKRDYPHWDDPHR